MRRNDTPGRIVTNVCTDVGVHEVITCADLYDYRLRGLGVAGVQILGFSVDLRCRPYNTLGLPCKCVISARYKNLSAGVRLKDQELPLFILGPPHISETNRARKLKFDTLVGICRYYGYL